MAYATIEDILKQIEEAEVIELTDDQDLGQVAEERVLRAIADADDEIDGYVGARYATPLDPVPSIIRKYSVDIAVYNLASRKDIRSEIRSERYKNAIRFLEQVGKGVVSLGILDPDGNPPTTDAPRMHRENPGRIFSRCTMEDY